MTDRGPPVLGRELTLACMLAFLGRALDLALYPPALKLEQTHAKDALVGRRPLLGGEGDISHERRQRGIVLREIRERIVELPQQVVARAAVELQ